MAFLKRGEPIEISPGSIQSTSSVTPIIDAKIIEDFAKYASNLKRIAPKAEDFLYFSAVMMHAAEASLLNEDGTQKLTSKGEAASAHWDRTGGSWRWKSNDPSVKPYKNSNGDIFPEDELIKAYKKWIGKPLCIDHKSSSVDHVRGFIVDTYYDRKLKRVIALCALDKFNYPDLARKVATGYSNSVSMGTAVGKAICSDCGTVAKTEADFCKCMRGRTCYGEINVDLNPIELSIVVNGADPLARIKQVIAHQVDALNNYVDSKQREISKVAEKTYKAYLTVEDSDKVDAVGESTLDEESDKKVFLSATSLEQLKRDVQEAFDKLQSLDSSLDEENMSENTNDTALPQTHSSVSMDESDLAATDSNIAPPPARLASDESGLHDQLKVVKAKLELMQRDLDKLAQFTNTSNQKQEEIMAGNKENLNKKGYFQGAGGDNEPTPGQVKYTKDPLNEQLRDNEDRQMQAKDVGGGDSGMADGDLEKKKMLARAQAEDRAFNRTAIVNASKARLEKIKEAYFNGAPESDPNKVLPYPVDKLQTELREKHDKQMVGQKPFPGVGNVDGLHPSPDSADDSDELKRKEKLLRAALKARFVKAAKSDGSYDAGKSAWEIYSPEGKLLLTASVEQISGGNSKDHHESVATKECAADLMSRVRKLGAERVAVGFLKKAQDAAPMLPEAAPPADAAPAAPMSDAGMGGPASDTGAEGDPKENAVELADQVRDLSSDLVEAVRALTGEQAEMGDVDAMKADDSSDSAVKSASLHTMRKELNASLISALKEAIATLNYHEQELKTIASMYEKGAVNEVNKDFVGNLVEESATETKEAIANSFKLLGAFVKYARGTQAIVKRAQEAALTQGNGENMAHNDSLMAMVDKGSSAMPAADALDAMLASDMAAADAAEEMDSSMDADDNDAGQVMTNDPAKAKEMAEKGLNVQVTASLNTSSKASRAAARAKLAAEMKWNPVLNEFHKHVDRGPDFDVKPTGNLGDVETIEQTHDAMMDVATAPVSVRKEAEAIHQLVSEGKLDPKDIDLLVANGVDADAVKYYKQFWGQAGSEGSQFATELLKEHAKAQLEEQMSQYRVKLARAYELTYEMVDRELIGRDRSSVTSQVDQVMKWNDESFESVRRVVANQKPSLRKEASGRMPQVGILGLNDNSSAKSEESDFASQLAAAFSKSSNRAF